MMNWLRERAFPGWTSAPIKSFSISSSGILALANLSIIADRTAITGTSTWFDVLVLVPGLYIQPSKGSPMKITNPATGEVFRLTNTSSGQYLKRIFKKEKGNGIGVPLAVDVDRSNHRGYYDRTLKYEHFLIDTYLSDIFYAPLPLLTIAAIIVIALAQDWWGLGIILCLIFARFLSVWVIRARSSDQPPPSKRPNIHESWLVWLDDHNQICLRGLCHDLQAFTQGVWMRPKTNVEECMDSISTLIVFLIAVFSDNSTQLSDIILMSLLLVSAALLALSNIYAMAFYMNGRTAHAFHPEARSDTAAQATAPTLSSLSHEDGGGIGMSSFEKREANVVSHSMTRMNDEISNV